MTRRRRGWVLAAAALAATIVYGNRRVLDGRAAPQWDAEWAFAPWFTLVADTARAGRLLLWDPWTNAGAPDFAEPQTGAFSPLVVGLGLALGGSMRAFCVYWLLTWCAGAWGMLILARHLRAPPWGGFVAALGFACSGFFTGHAEHTSFIHAFAALPWIVWRLDCALQRRQARPAVEAGALWGLCALAGYPAVVMLDLGLAILWAAGRLAFPTPRPRRPALGLSARARWAGASIGLAVGVGMVVISPTYVGFLVETRGYSVRSKPLPRDVAVTSNALAPGALATLASPYLSTLRFVDPDLWRETDASSSSVYVGAVVLWLAVLSVAARPRRGARWGLLGLGLLGLGLAFGQALPLRGWLYDLVWPSRYFRHAALFRGWLIFALAVLAALASRDLETARRRSARRVSARGVAGLIAAVALSGAALAAFEGVVRALPGRGPDLSFARLHVAGGAAVVCIAALAAAVPRRGWRLALPALLVAAAAADAGAVWRLTAAMTATTDPRLLELWKRAESERRADLVVTPNRWERSTWDSAPGNKNLLTKRPVLISYGPLQSPIYKRWTHEPVLVAAATGRRRFFFSPRAVETPASLSDFDFFVERARALGVPPLVVQRPAAMLASAPAGIVEPGADWRGEALDPARRVSTRIHRYLPDELVLTVECPEDGWLLVTDRWAPSWRASVNGVETPVWGGDFVFRAVAVRAGSNRVSFRYTPFAFPYLVALSWTTLLAAAAAALRAAVVGRPPRAREGNRGGGDGADPEPATRAGAR